MKKILNTVGAVIAFLAFMVVSFQIHPEGFLRRSEEAVTSMEIETAGVSTSFAGRKAGEGVLRVASREEFMAQYPFEYFTVEPINITPTGVYELPRWKQATTVVGHRTWNYPRVTTSFLWGMTGYNQYYMLELADGSYALALFDKSTATNVQNGGGYTLPICLRAGVDTYAKPALQETCLEYGADLDNVIYAIDDTWYQEHDGQLIMIRLGIMAGLLVISAILWVFLEDLIKKRK